MKGVQCYELLGGIAIINHAYATQEFITHHSRHKAADLSWKLMAY